MTAQKSKLSNQNLKQLQMKQEENSRLLPKSFVNTVGKKPKNN